MKREVVAGIIALVLVLGLIGLVSAADEFEDTVQYHWDMDGDGFGDHDDLENLWTVYDYNGINYWFGVPYGSILQIVTKPSGYSKAIFLWAAGVTTETPNTHREAYIKNLIASDSEYWSFTVRDAYFDDAGKCDAYLYITFYDKSGSEIGKYDIRSYVNTYHSNDLFEFFVSGGSTYLYINGDSKGVIGACSDVPYYIKIEAYIACGPHSGGGGDADSRIYVDDIKNEDCIVGIGAEPCNTGAFTNHTIIESDNYRLDVSWASKAIVSADYTSAQYDLKVKRTSWGEWYNVTNLKEAGNSSAKPCGFVVYNWSTLFKTNHYGLYWFSVYKDDTEVAKDFLFFKDIGEDSYINIEETEYSIGSPMNVSYWIETPDFGANDYWIYMYDSSGGKVDELELFEQANTHEFTSTIDWEVGTCYAVLVKDTQPNIDVDPPTDIIDLAYDFTWLSSKIIIQGHVWDATNPDNLVDGTPLSNVSVNFTQNNQWYNATSEADGYYEFIDLVTFDEMAFYKDTPITVTATKSGYRHDSYTAEIIRAGTYYIDLYLVPSERTENQEIKNIFTGLVEDYSSIAGLVLDEPFHQAVEGAAVYIWNETWSETMTTNKWGFYSTKLLTTFYNGTFNSSEYDTWVNLTHSNIVIGTEIVKNDTFVFERDEGYNMNYTDGKIKCLSDGSMGNYTEYNIRYHYYRYGWRPSNIKGLGNNTYLMRAEKEGFSKTAINSVNAHHTIHTLDNCDVFEWYEAALDECDSLTNNGNWGSANNISLNTSDYVEPTGSLQTIGAETLDCQKVFTSPIDSNVTKEGGYFYFYSHILNKNNINSDITIYIGSNGSNSTDFIKWDISKDKFETAHWDLVILSLEKGTETGSCNLAAVNYFELKSGKTDNVTTKIDDLRFIEYVGWGSSLNLSLDTSKQKEGSGSIKAEGNWTWREFEQFNESETDYDVWKLFNPLFDAEGIDKTHELTRSEFWFYDWYDFSGNLDLSCVLASGETTDYIYFDNIVTEYNNWDNIKLWFNDAYEGGNLDISALKYWILFGDCAEDGIDLWIDYIQLKQVGVTYHNFGVDEYYDLTVHAKEMDTHNTITDFKAVWDLTNVKETTDGTIVFTNITYGIYRLEVTSDGFYTSKQYIFMGQDTEETVYLFKIDEGGGGVGLYYPPPHLVEFGVQNIWGKTYPNALVTVQGYSTTMGSWDWLWSLFGYKNETQIHNTTMSDTTDSNGHLSFMMVETIKYQINVSDTESPTRFDNKTFWIAPKDERYNLVVSEGWKWQKAGTEVQKEMSINVTASTNDTHAFINVSYNDPSNKTTFLAFYLNHTVDNNVEECLQSVNWSNTSVKEHSFVLSEYEGRAFKIQVVTEHEEWGNRTWTYAKRFEGMLIDLGLPDTAYPMIAIAVLLFLGGVFGRSSATQGSLVICFGGWFFWAIGFLTLIPNTIILPAISLATIVSIIALMSEKGKREGVQ